MDLPTSQQVRRRFLEYFRKRNHSLIPSAPVIPHDDPTLLFNNAGMNQFKDVFLGTSQRDYQRATSSQKCIRAGGKHNDLENVGHTKRHVTFFEMLGNFSFGDYFKEEAIRFAWEVSTEVFDFDAQRLWPTVFLDDDEAFDIWTQYVPAERITRFGEEENYWAMGDTGPRGPCSEILYDRGKHYGDAPNPSSDSDGERYLEFWNLVFMQYNRNSDGSISSLPKPSIDTGAGLERIMALIYDVDTVFDTDILKTIITTLSEKLQIPYDPIRHPDNAAAFRVIADHIRCLAFAITDGAQPSNLDRGYVLRKILRRAVRYGRQLANLQEPFLASLLPPLINTMGDDYPELRQSQGRIQEILTIEEESFQRTLRRGKNMLGQIIDRSQMNKTICGDDAFKLKDTYGFPIDEIVLIANDADLSVDLERFKKLENEAKERSRKAHKTTEQVAEESLFNHFVNNHGTSEFIGYTQHVGIGKIVGIVVDGSFVESLSPNTDAMVLIDKTPFYAEMGGQVGDIGVIKSEEQLFNVKNCIAPYNGVIAHVGTMKEGSLYIGDTVTAEVDFLRRQKIANNHTATHLLHWALSKVLGEHIRQAGSVVDDERLRFDFNHHKAVTKEEVCAIEDLINEKIRENNSVRWYEIDFNEAQQRSDIKQFFGDKYGNKVRVVDIDYCKELCGGTHTNAVGNIGYFRIAKESSIAAGVRRIEAITGNAAEEFTRQSDKLIERVSEALKTQPKKLESRIEKLLEDNKALQQQIEALHKANISDLANQIIEKKELINNIPIIATSLDISISELTTCADTIIETLGSGVLVLAVKQEARCQLTVRISDDIVEKGLRAGDLIKQIAPIVDGKGGGKANAAQAGGNAPEKIDEALQKAKELLEKLTNVKTG